MELTATDFELFGLPPCHRVDRVTLDAQWRRLQALVHPDRFAAEGAAAQRIAMQWAVRVNEAYRRLKDPLRRAAYLCELRGVAVSAESNTAMPPAFLAQQIAWREALDDAATADELQALAADVLQHRAALLEQLSRTLDERQDAVAAAHEVRALMFVERFEHDVGRRLEALEA